jgi:hypothetical protein
MPIITREAYKDLAQLTDDSLDAVIDLLIPAVEEDYLKLRGVPFELDVDGDPVYPAGSVITAKLMLDWLLSAESGKVLSSGLKSESIGKYSFTAAEIDGDSGYPRPIIGRIDRYARGR